MEFREALEKATQSAWKLHLKGFDPFPEFLQSLEALTGGKFVMPEPTVKMLDAAWDVGDLSHEDAAELHAAMHAAAPTVTEIVGEK